MSLSVLRAIRILDAVAGDAPAEGERQVTFTPAELRRAVYMATRALTIERASVFLPNGYVSECVARYAAARHWPDVRSEVDSEEDDE